MENKHPFSVIIGLGNRGNTYEKTRHNIGFRIINMLCEKYDSQWEKKDDYSIAKIIIHNKTILLIKPETGMNVSGFIMPKLLKMGYNISDCLAIYDDLEKKFGQLQLRLGGSHRGHNGVRSLMTHGQDFWRLRFGIGRPELASDVPNYVLAKFTPEEEGSINTYIANAIHIIETELSK